MANVDLWQPFVELYLSRQREITFEWVKGHSGDPMNDLVDRLAVVASGGRSSADPAAPPSRPPCSDVPRAAEPASAHLSRLTGTARSRRDRARECYRLAEPDA